MSTVSQLLEQRRLLQSVSDSPGLDVELLLAHCLRQSRTYLYTYPDVEVSAEVEAAFGALLARRSAGEPVAHLLGYREFWSLKLAVSPATLIPRPDTECLVEKALELMPERALLRALDLGTGTGAIALALASERPHWQVLGVDAIAAAVVLAQQNAQRLGIANASFAQSDWFSALAKERFDLIVSNPPYVAEDDPHLGTGDVRFEPRSALVAGSDGLDDIRHIAPAALEFLAVGGWLLLEHGFDQGAAVRACLRSAGYDDIDSGRDLGGHERITWGRRSS